MKFTAILSLLGVVAQSDATYERCSTKLRIFGYFMQDTTQGMELAVNKNQLGAWKVGRFGEEVSSFLNHVDHFETTNRITYNFSSWAVHSFRDRAYASGGPAVHQLGDYLPIAPLLHTEEAQKRLAKGFPFALAEGGGGNSDAFDVMYHIAKSQEERVGMEPLEAVEDLKVLYVFTNGVPRYSEATKELCEKSGSKKPCSSTPDTAYHCYVNGVPDESAIDYSVNWNTTSCPVSLTKLGSYLKDHDWHIIYMNIDDTYNWDQEVKMMGMEDRFLARSTDYNYTNVASALLEATNTLICPDTPFFL